MDIGTAKPTTAQRLGVPHHMIDIILPWEDYSVARYVTDATKCIEDILSRGKLPVVAGGTELYIDSLILGREFSARGDPDLRRELQAEYDNAGGEKMLGKLREYDPESAAGLHINDKKRIIRALEVYITTGKPISQHNAETKSLPPRYESIKITLTFSDRKDLYTRIEKRVETMLDSGLLHEVQELIKMGVPQNCTAMQAIGYKEMAAAINGEYSVADAIEKIKMESRRYAKRQLTWLRRDENVKWLTWEKEPDFDKGLEFLENISKE